MKPKIIRTEADYAEALARIEVLMEGDPEPTSPEGEELELLGFLVDTYETAQFPMDMPSPVEAIKFRMDQQGLKHKDLVPYIGSKSKVSEVLSGRRELSKPMIRNLVTHLGIPADVLLQETGASLPPDTAYQQGKHFPISEMLKRGWFHGFKGTLAEAKTQLEDLLHGFVGKLGANALIPALNRQLIRDNGKQDSHALNAWRIRVANLALNESIHPYTVGTVTPEFLKDLAILSSLSAGPLLAKEFLNKNGVHLICESHLPKTHLDGAALKLPNGTPVVALTLRHDRLDHFWFTLFHELAHVALHLDQNSADVFFDDLMAEGKESEWEREADALAAASLIPDAEWQSARLTAKSSPASVLAFSERLRISPAIPAGRIRYGENNYVILRSLIGAGTVRPMFGIQKN
jgi:HTH-type transcriptional regulator/antitoxin HigA